MEMGSWGGGGQKCPKYSELPVLMAFFDTYKGQCQKCPDDQLEDMAEWRWFGWEEDEGAKVSSMSHVF